VRGNPESTAMSDEHEEVWKEFRDRVNMTQKELTSWLESEESQQVGDFSKGSESTGHKSGRRIVDLLETKKADLSDDDFDHMRKVNGYISRHLAQRPSGDVTDTRWRYSLMNWGHDPQK
jgi:hypothetical protein